ncbi:class II aldolase/adducin family protein [Dasania marina]|uniref:class II aldolase/adducin family protein n=1 Tax=Dasania marina TaxID=471499 RepID=UPI0030DCA541|tara:strand:- start:30311 stop:30649 length:339 start_codon:yes stop_codon:yes gene_type:complete
MSNPINCSAAEWQQRVNLAAAFQLCHFYGFSDLIWTHLSARVPDEDGLFLLNPSAYMFDEITASNLVKVDIDGNAVNGGHVNPAPLLFIVQFTGRIMPTVVQFIYTLEQGVQ